MCCQKKRYNSVFSERGRLEQSPVITPLWGCERNLGGTFGLAPLVYRRGNGLNSTNFSRAEPTSDLSTGNPDKDGGRASSKWSERGGQGRVESGEPCFCCLIHETAACRCLCVSGAARRAGVAEGGPTPGLQARQTTTVASECHGGCTWCYQVACGRGSPWGRKAEEGRRGDKAGHKAGRKRFVSQKVLRVVRSGSASQTAREDVKGTVRGKGGRRRTGSSDRDQTLRIPVKPC